MLGGIRTRHRKAPFHGARRSRVRVINSLWCSCKARFQELKKRAGQVCTLMALANSYMA